MILAVICVAPSAGELIAKARALSAKARVVALCEADGESAAYFGACGADELLRLPACADDCAQGTRIARALDRLAPDSALFPATVRGRFLSAWVAAKLETGLTADCTALSLTAEGHLLQTRPAYGGNLTADILCRDSRPQLASVRPGVFPPPAPNPACPSARDPGDGEGPLPRNLPRLLERLGFVPAEGGVPLARSRIIVAGGKGIGSREGFAVLGELSHLLGGALGATRGAVDAGWIPYAHQIGQTGVTVRPKLYLAFGISGMIQHLTGMSGAETVVAVNTDPFAPIFDHADYGIVADWQATAAAMIRHLKERKGTR